MNTTNQLTKHPVGSMREVWSLAWPLIISLISTGFMLFVDRFLLSRHSLPELNASATGSLMYYFFLIIPLIICGISEVLVGRLNGEKNFHLIGKAVWSVALFPLCLTPLFFLVTQFLTPLLFYGSDSIHYESIYFKVLLSFAPIYCTSLAFSGFFVGLGKVRTVVITTLAGNLLNFALAYLLIFGVGIIPSLGIRGAAFATGLSQTFQTVILLFLFLRKKNRETYGSHSIGIDLGFLKEALKIGVPAGLSKLVEIGAHCAFFRILMTAGPQEMTLVVLAMTMYTPLGFIIEALSKSVSTLVANLLGSGQRELIESVVRSAFKLNSLFFISISLLLLLAASSFLPFFIPAENQALLQDPHFTQSFIVCVAIYCLFFLFDSSCWILNGLFTAAGDTKFVFYVSCLMNWLGYVAPAFFLIKVAHLGGVTASALITGYTGAIFLVFLLRYRSGAWLNFYKKTEPETVPATA